MSDPIREVLTELLRLYDWRFALAEREAPPQFARTDEYHAETKRLLNQYGREKKAAWLAARAVLAVRPEERAPDGYAVLMDDKASAPAGFWFCGIWNTKEVAEQYMAKQRGGCRLVPMSFASSPLAPHFKEPT